MAEKMIAVYGDVDYSSFDLIDKTVITFDCSSCNKKEKIYWRSFKNDRRLLCSECKRVRTNVEKFGAKTWGEAAKGKFH